MHEGVPIDVTVRKVGGVYVLKNPGCKEVCSILDENNKLVRPCKFYDHGLHGLGTCKKDC
ncbi:hypothetical protein SAMN05660330_01442 [Desulforhopalus singaporensis]|uniref:Uncharacterized protein n=1 Tax=Desulforhopalus singaporensis TaxID=91360 RepID=A0A1H0NUL1_9BACT|nr:hypothetical protein SAMN05660330_01442 [Desulforhopalus singaporensis]